MFQKADSSCSVDFRKLLFLKLLSLSKEENPLDEPGLSEVQEIKRVLDACSLNWVMAGLKFRYLWQTYY